MPRVQANEFQVAPKGTYLSMLCEIQEKSTPQRNEKTGDMKDSKFWVWKFSGYQTKDPQKKRTPIEVTTGIGVSSKASALKHILSCAYPEMSVDEMKAFDTDTMIGKAWVLKVGVEEKPNGGEKNVILNIEASDKDPFADDDDE